MIIKIDKQKITKPISNLIFLRNKNIDIEKIKYNHNFIKKFDNGFGCIDLKSSFFTPQKKIIKKNIKRKFQINQYGIGEDQQEIQKNMNDISVKLKKEQPIFYNNQIYIIADDKIEEMTDIDQNKGYIIKAYRLSNSDIYDIEDIYATENELTVIHDSMTAEELQRAGIALNITFPTGFAFNMLSENADIVSVLGITSNADVFCANILKTEIDGNKIEFFLLKLTQLTPILFEDILKYKNNIKVIKLQNTQVSYNSEYKNEWQEALKLIDIKNATIYDIVGYEDMELIIKDNLNNVNKISPMFLIPIGSFTREVISNSKDSEYIKKEKEIKKINEIEEKNKEISDRISTISVVPLPSKTNIVSNIITSNQLSVSELSTKNSIANSKNIYIILFIVIGLYFYFNRQGK